MEISTHCFKSNSALATSKVWGESDYYSDLKKEDKQIKRSSNCELVPDPNVSISLQTLFCYLSLFVSLQIQHHVTSLLIRERKNQKEEVAERSQNNAASKKWWIKAGDVHSFNKSDYDSSYTIKYSDLDSWGDLDQI